MIEKNGNVEKFLSNEGICITGKAHAKILPSVPKEFSPSALLKNAASVICYAVVIPKGIIYADTYGNALYWRYCNMMYRFLDTVSNKLCVYLEEIGYTAAPVYSCYPWKVMDREFWGVLPLVYWAEEAGLGSLTKCGLLAHPVYGTRILLGGTVTTMEVSSPKKSGDVCPPDCVVCIEACPAKAIDRTGKVDHNTCIRYANENPLLHHLLQEKPRPFSFETLVNTVGVDDHGTYLCLECMRACPLNKG